MENNVVHPSGRNTQQSKDRTISRSSIHKSRGPKQTTWSSLDSTGHAYGQLHQKGSSFDDSFLSALDQLKLNGYEEYAKKSDSTSISIQDIFLKLRNLKILPGVLEDFIYLLKRSFSSPQYCSMSIDIHTIKPMIQYVDDAEFFLGCVSPLSEDVKLAGEVAVFVVRGLETNWKGIVGYMLICFEDDSWALWHTLFKVIEFLLDNNIFVVNVSLSKEFGFEMLEKHSHVELQDGAFIKQPLRSLDLLCFSRDVLELLEDFSKCIVQFNVNLTDQILEKYNLVHKELSHENLRLFIGDKILSASSIFSWFISWKSTCESVDLSSISLQSETFLMHMIGKWSSIMRTCSETESLGSVCSSTDAHLQFLNEIVWIVQSLEEVEQNVDLLQLWGNMKQTTMSVLALYNCYVGKGLLTCLRPGLLRNATLHTLKAKMECEIATKPSPLVLLRFLQHVNFAIFLTPNMVETDFENGDFLKQYVEQFQTFIPKVDCVVPNVMDLGLYVLSSQIVTKLIHDNACDKCRSSLVAKQIIMDLPQQWLKAVKDKKLIHPSLNVYDTLQWAETHLINTQDNIFKMQKAKSQLAFRVYGEMAFSIRNSFPSCHEVMRKMLSLFMGFRLQMMAEDLTRSLT